MHRLSETIHNHPGTNLVVRPMWLSDREPQKFLDTLFTYAGTSYDFEGVLAFVVRLIKKNFKKQDSKKVFCSELIALGLEDIHYHWIHKLPEDIAPGDFDDTRYFSRIGSITI